MASVQVDQRRYDQEVRRLTDLVLHLDQLEPQYQKMVAEIVMLRLCSLLESTIESVASKLLSGSPYADGSPPILLLRSRSMRAAMDNMMTHGRAKPLKYLRWSEAGIIGHNVRNLLDRNDNFATVVTNHGRFLDEMRRVRNRVAHNSAKSRSEFGQVVLQYYGANPSGVTVGVLLKSKRFAPTLIERYLQGSRVLVRALVKG